MRLHLLQEFRAQRELVYPASFRALLEQLGTDPNKEAEASEHGPVEVTAGERNYHAPDSHHFDYWFTSIGPSAPAFRGGPRLTLEVTTHLTWLLEDLPEPRAGSRAARPII